MKRRNVRAVVVVAAAAAVVLVVVVVAAAVVAAGNQPLQLQLIKSPAVRKCRGVFCGFGKRLLCSGLLTRTESKYRRMTNFR
jgi:hypothetical protein